MFFFLMRRRPPRPTLFPYPTLFRSIAWNRPAEALLGYAEAEVLGWPCHLIIRALTAEGQPLCIPNCQAKLCFGRCQPYAAPSCLTYRKSGEQLPVSLSTITMPPALQEGRITAVIFIRPWEEDRPHLVAGCGLRLFTLGRFGAAVGDRGLPFQRWERRQALTLLKYLLTYRGRAVHRERLMYCLWPEVSARQGRKRLKVIVYSLRRELRSAGLPDELIETTGECYILRSQDLWVDADVFEELVQDGCRLAARQQQGQALQRYQDAELLYRGDYLEEERYADWCAEERERLREIYLELLSHMAGLYGARGDYTQAAQLCRKALVKQPCRESTHRALMEYLWRDGRRDEALAQFNHCKQVLAQELEVEPLLATKQLSRQILQGAPYSPVAN